LIDKMIVGCQRGVTLVELLIVVSIVAILASIAYPAYQTHMTKTRHADAKIMLLQIMQQQRKYFTSNNTYTTDLVGEFGYADAGSGDVVSDNGFYLITASACGAEPLSECVLLSGVTTYAGGGTPLTYNSRNQKTPPEHW